MSPTVFEIGDLVVGCRMWNKDRLGIVLSYEHRGDVQPKTPVYNVMWVTEDALGSDPAPFTGSVSREDSSTSWEDQTSIRDIYKMYDQER